MAPPFAMPYLYLHLVVYQHVNTLETQADGTKAPPRVPGEKVHQAFPVLWLEHARLGQAHDLSDSREDVYHAARLPGHTRRDHARPFDDGRNAYSTLPQILFESPQPAGCISRHHRCSTVVTAEPKQRVVLDPKGAKPPPQRPQASIERMDLSVVTALPQTVVRLPVLIQVDPGVMWR